MGNHADLGEAERHALRRGRTVRRGQGYSLHVTALPDVHQALLAAAAALNTDGTSSAERKAYRIYADRLNAVVSAVPALALLDAAGPQQRPGVRDVRAAPAVPRTQHKRLPVPQHNGRAVPDLLTGRLQAR